MSIGYTVIKLRQAKFEDLPILQELYVQTIESTCRKDYEAAQRTVWKSSVENKHRWIDAIETQYFVVAEIAQVVVGFGSLKHGEHVDFMYVHHDYLRKGIADTIYQALEKQAKRCGKTSMTSDVSKTARPFFEKKGFVVEKVKHNMISGVEIVNYRMINDIM